MHMLGASPPDPGAPRAELGPGPAQICRISGFVNSKTDGENAEFCPNYGLKKKRSSPKF